MPEEPAFWMAIPPRCRRYICIRSGGLARSTFKLGDSLSDADELSHQRRQLTTQIARLTVIITDTR